MKRNHLVLAILFVLCAGVLAFSDRRAGDQLVEAAPHTSTRAAPATRFGSAASVSIEALRSRADLIGLAGGETHELFGHLSPTSPLPSAAPANAEVPPLPPSPPTPSMPFTYIGKQSADGHWEVYLARGDDTLIVRDHAVIDGTYRVEAITPPTMKLVYLPLKLVQTLDIGSAE
ncbi:hypothetical protein R69608_07514 [Paraburkholderia nemoris]|uniref:Secretion system X translation initiation factor n=1 Tax=Paraburkholderia nemoris TaxID=2793076 RepID=A0ABM8T4Z3_9BURK|nr:MULTISPECIES: hypothetical protein [Paraburkholderia]MBK3816213.1 hypothetical protein [Paraburkholderia aspalathi]MBK5153037.1 hypothetical protein [Burkholderia sp. R-69608]CAE6856967.1 hypothetical protein R69776_07791 [Paraburkholderia nemoris]CAE6971213.1 hypothetical protein R69608_07514 [Paraburkholderia nemoris]